MPADNLNDDSQGLPKFGEILSEVTAAVFRELNSCSGSARVLRKHWLLAQAELLKGYQEVIRLELEATENPPPEKSTKINID